MRLWGGSYGRDGIRAVGVVAVVAVVRMVRVVGVDECQAQAARYTFGAVVLFPETHRVHGFTHRGEVLRLHHFTDSGGLRRFLRLLV